MQNHKHVCGERTITFHVAGSIIEMRGYHHNSWGTKFRQENLFKTYKGDSDVNKIGITQVVLVPFSMKTNDYLCYNKRTSSCGQNCNYRSMV